MAQPLVNFVGAAHAVDGFQQILFAVVVRKRCGLFAVDIEPCTNRLFVVIVPLNQFLAGIVVSVGNFRRIELDVVTASAGQMESASGDALHHRLFIDFDFQHTVDLLTTALEHFI